VVFLVYPLLTRPYFRFSPNRTTRARPIGETMAVAELIVSRREVLGAASALAVAASRRRPGSSVLSPRHSGPDPESPFPSPTAAKRSEIPGRARNDEKWQRALACYLAAEAALAAAAHSEDEELYDRLGIRLSLS
jgi:hypothetical protein